jgi:hypothetical protein
VLAKGDTNSASQEIQRLGWDYPDYKDLIDFDDRLEAGVITDYGLGLSLDAPRESL